MRVGEGRERPRRAPAPVDVRAIRADDLGAVCARLPERSCAIHAARLARQEAGALTYLVAWDGTVPVGHALLQFPADTDEPMEMARRLSCAEVSDLYVQPARRRRGAGLALVTAAEERVRDRGVVRLGLATGPDERYAPARALYASCGFVGAGLGPYLEGCTYRDEAGGRRVGIDLVVYMVKDLE